MEGRAYLLYPYRTPTPLRAHQPRSAAVRTHPMIVPQPYEDGPRSLACEFMDLDMHSHVPGRPGVPQEPQRPKRGHRCGQSRRRYAPGTPPNLRLDKGPGPIGGHAVGIGPRQERHQHGALVDAQGGGLGVGEGIGYREPSAAGVLGSFEAARPTVAAHGLGVDARHPGHRGGGGRAAQQSPQAPRGDQGQGVCGAGRAVQERVGQPPSRERATLYHLPAFGMPNLLRWVVPPQYDCGRRARRLSNPSGLLPLRGTATLVLHPQEMLVGEGATRRDISRSPVMLRGVADVPHRPHPTFLDHRQAPP